MVGGLSQRPNLTEGPAAAWDLRRSIKEEEYFLKKWNFSDTKIVIFLYIPPMIDKIDYDLKS
jgi:hypothetical protein